MTKKLSEMKTACIYIRVSTDKQEELSPDAQKRLIIDYAKKNNLSVTKESIFTENGISGKKADKRPEFMKMIGLAKSKEHPYDVILVWKFSRFARNQEESIVYKSLLKKNSVDVVSISEPLIDGPFGSLIERIIEWMDEYYSIRLSGEVMRGMTEKAMRGGYQSGLPMGYKMNRDTKIPYIVEEEANLVRRIYNLYAYDGSSYLEIAREVNALGFKTKRGNAFEERTIRYILANPFYTGDVRWNRQDHTDHTIKNQSEWIIASGEHDAIISSELFNLVQEQIAKRSRPYKSRSTSSVNHWLVGMVRCSSCNHTLLACSRGNKNGTFTFQCGAYNKGACHVSHSISSHKLEGAVLGALKEVLDTGNITYELRQTSASREENDIELMNSQLKKLDAKELRIKQAYRDGIDTIEEYKENKQLLQEERNQINLQIEKVTSAPTNNTEMLQEVKNVYEIISNPNVDKRIRGNALRSVVDRIIYDKPNDTLKVFFYLSQRA